MGRKVRELNPEIIKRRIKEGRGQGEGRKYVPFLTTRDVASLGLRSRVKGEKTGRVHHLLSLLELYFFYYFDWLDNILDIREQFPLLPLAETVDIAEQNGIKHPRYPKNKQLVVLTTDFLITYSGPKGGKIFKAFTVKYSIDLEKKRTLEKLELERLYWNRRQIEWSILTEKQINEVVVNNLKYLHPYKDFDSLYPLKYDEVEYIAKVLKSCIINDPAIKLRDAANICGKKIGFASGKVLQVVRYLIASKTWKVNMSDSIDPCMPLQVISYGNEGELNAVTY